MGIVICGWESASTYSRSFFTKGGDKLELIEWNI